MRSAGGGERGEVCDERGTPRMVVWLAALNSKVGTAIALTVCPVVIVIGKVAATAIVVGVCARSRGRIAAEPPRSAAP